MADKEKKKEAREELQEMTRQAKADKLRLKEEQRQHKMEEKEKYPTAALRRKARRLRWKQEKAARRQALKDHYRDAPWIIRVPRLYLLKPFIALLIIAALGFGAVKVVPNMFVNSMFENKNNPVSQEQIEALSPIDKEGAKRIDATAPVGKDDTWTICVYISGSDLEDAGEDDLSAIVGEQIEEEMAMQASISGEKRANRLNSFTSELKENDLDFPAYLYYPQIEEEHAMQASISEEKRSNRLNNFTSELKENDLDFPAYLYYPSKPPAASQRGEQSSGPVVADRPGAASLDIGEMTAGKWSDKISIVIQTGGATRWSHPMVNPNRTQRFLYKNGELKEVYDQPVQRTTDPKTLTSFLKFCNKEYPADHTMLVLWNHGGGAFGYGHDSLSDSMMSLEDVREGLKGAYKPNIKDPAFDIIGFDACLMSSLEVTHALDGFASYYALSEEVEPGEGWDYTPWLKAMSEDPTMSPAWDGCIPMTSRSLCWTRQKQENCMTPGVI